MLTVMTLNFIVVKWSIGIGFDQWFSFPLLSGSDFKINFFYDNSLLSFQSYLVQ